MNTQARQNTGSLALDSVSKRVEWLMDRSAIEDIQASYARAIDRGELGILKSVYHKDARDEHGMFSGTGHQFAEFVLPHIRAHNATMQHHWTTTSMDIRGDKAAVEIYYICVQRTLAGDLEFSGGRCADQFEKRDGRWGIVHRQVIMDWTELNRNVEVVAMDPAFVKGDYCDLDISYRVIPTMRLGGFYQDRHGATVAR